MEDVLASRIICKPLHLLDCCVETDNATAIIVTSADRARDGRHPRALIRGVAGACASRASTCTTSTGRSPRSPASTRARSCGRTRASGPEDVDVTGSYDAFTFTTMLQLEDYGFCKKGEGGQYVSDGTIKLGGRRPNNTSGGHLCEGYTHGMNMVIENVRQLRHDVDDCMPGRRRRQAPAHLRLQGGRLPAGASAARSPPTSAGPCRAPARPWSCGAVEGGGNDHADPRRDYLGMSLSRRRSRQREPRLLQALRRARLPPAGAATAAGCCAIRRPRRVRGA